MKDRTKEKEELYRKQNNKEEIKKRFYDENFIGYSSL